VVLEGCSTSTLSGLMLNEIVDAADFGPMRTNVSSALSIESARDFTRSR